jgi:hypothetical protein
MKTVFPLLASLSPLRAREAPVCGRGASQMNTEDFLYDGLAMTAKD